MGDSITSLIDFVNWLGFPVGCGCVITLIGFLYMHTLCIPFH